MKTWPTEHSIGRGIKKKAVSGEQEVVPLLGANCGTESS